MLKNKLFHKHLVSMLIFTGALFGSHSARASLILPSRATSYYPNPSQMEGGYVDRRGKQLYSIQQYVKGEAPYVSVAMDSRVFPYGTPLQIPEIERYYNMSITFRVVDTGNAFRGRGYGRIDICTESYRTSIEKVVNQNVTLITNDLTKNE